MKTCSKCLKTKTLMDFHKDAQKCDGFSSRCKNCAHIARVKRYSETREKSIAYSKEWARNNPSLVKLYQQDFLLANPNYIKEKKAKEYIANRENILKSNSLWQKIHKATCSARLAKYRASKKKSTPLWANLDKIKEFYIATDILNMITGEWHEVDHIIPLQSDMVCGLHIESNLQILTRSENRSKGNRLCL